MGWWVPALAVAVAVSLVATPVMRQVGLRFDIVDQPSQRKFHASPVPYLGGIALMAAVALAVGIGSDVGPGGFAVVLVAAAVALGVVGLVDDMVGLGALVRLGAQAAAAVVALGVGVRIDVTGVVVVDAAITLVWIVAVANAFNMIDNMDGLSGGVAAAVAAGATALAVLGDEPVAAAVAAAVVGASAGYLVWNLSPRKVFMGDAGSMFLGFLLAVLAVDVAGSRGTRSAGIVTLALLVGLLLIDLVAVVAGRYLHGRAVGSGGRDHLSHRLVGLGLRPRPAVAVLVAVQAAMAGAAVAVGRGALDPGWGLVLGLGLAAGLVAIAFRAAVYDGRALAGRGRRVAAAVTVAAVFGVVGLVVAGNEPASGPEALLGGGGTPGRAALVALGAISVTALPMATQLRTRKVVPSAAASRREPA